MNSNIALLTDFGTKDYFVGAMKGAILSINETTNIIDITHEIPAQDVLSASFTLRACYKDFPFKTIFVAVVDPEVGSNRKAILVETKNFCFIAPDNGLLSFIFDEEENFCVRELTNKSFFAAEVSRTFHGRDVFARVAAHLSKGVNPSEFGAEIKNFIHLKTAEPRKISEREIEASIIHIDRFGNLITNLKQTDLPESFTLRINGKIIDKLQSFFAGAKSNELFMILGSAGFLEIAAFQDSAEKLLNARINQKVLLVT
ncbi:MAG: SAM-dependent chlorinase/fluorinase [Acidobacteriota bacterium]|nr:SAM-dependent chlorinase/fluorinase [Acidobacteriota bacterium]